MDQELAEAPDLGTAVASIVDRILRSVPVDRQLSLVQTELEIHAVRRPDLGRPFLEANERFRSRIAVYLEAAMARNGLELTVDPVDVVDASVAVVERSVRRALLAGGDADPDAMARAVLPAMLLALSRPVEPDPRSAHRVSGVRPGRHATCRTLRRIRALSGRSRASGPRGRPAGRRPRSAPAPRSRTVSTGVTS